jgi:hypothetical protein
MTDQAARIPAPLAAESTCDVLLASDVPLASGLIADGDIILDGDVILDRNVIAIDGVRLGA